MEPEHWHRVWSDNQLGFHQPAGNPMLQRWFPELALATGSRVLVPLCGKTPDLAWLAAQGFEVVGAELSEVAVRDFFAERDVDPTISNMRGITKYAVDGVEILVGDLFEVDAEMVGPVDAVYDRAALVALPADMRTAYAKHLLAISGHAPQLLVTFEYDQEMMAGPPFSVGVDEVARLYARAYRRKRLGEEPVPDGLRGVPAQECAWLLDRGPADVG